MDAPDIKDGGERQPGAVAQLRGVMAEAAVTVLAPVAKRVATHAAKSAVERAPEVIEDTIIPRLQDLGSRFGGGGGDDDEDDSGRAGDGTGKGRRMPVQQAVDVAAPLQTVYDQFTQFEDFPKFMHRVERVEQRDDEHVVFHEKIWGVRRQWEAEILEQKPDARIVWRTKSGMRHLGVVTFHELADSLTRVEVNLDLEPDGPVEKLARGARFVKRATRADLKRFKAFVEMRDEETGAWRGVIEDGDVVEEDDYEDEPESYEDEDERDEDERDDDDEERERPTRRRQPAKSSNGGSSSRRSSPQRRKKASGKQASGNGRRTRAKSSAGKRSS